MAEAKAEAPCLKQLLDEVTPSADTSDGLMGIADNINMEDVLSVLNQASNGSLGDVLQIIKRLHSHSHEPPNPDELPPWLLLKSEDGDTPPPGDYVQTATPPSACVLLPCPVLPAASSIQNLAQLIEQAEEKVVTTAEAEEESATPPATTSEPPRKRRRRSKQKEVRAPADVVSVKELFLQHPAEFWELFETTKKMVRFLKGEEGPSTTSCVTSTDSGCDSVVAKFLDDANMSKYKSVFARFSMDVMRSLSTDELTRLCRNEADALCIYHSLKIKFSSAPDVSSVVKVFVGEMSACSGDEPIYQMMLLKNQTKEEFVSFLERKGMVDTAVVERFCVPGPGGIRVELSDEIVSSWKDESVFYISIVKGVCRLDPIASSQRRNTRSSTSASS
ncbi:unnamed protein product [Heligmosomoides polygyrus]|uniref:GRHL1/CP2 C-terminal domain-containing protein n=1 Tax=Heligmosomoides polygyrus TaxID=6339 RepID=A0A3P7YQH7_HELPZ|nr:unnamed protein product [Heligmosomoides polygyrus]